MKPIWPSQRSTVWNMSVFVTPYFSAALRNWEICSICLKAMGELWIFFTGFSPANRLLMSSLKTWREKTKPKRRVERGGQLKGRRKEGEAQIKDFYLKAISSRKHPGSLCTHTSVLEPSLEALFAGLWLPHTRATLTADPLHQNLLQLWVVLAVDLVLDLPTQAVGWTFVSHAGTLGQARWMEMNEKYMPSKKKG